MDKQEVESGYASRSRITIDRLHELGLRAEDLGRQVCELKQLKQSTSQGEFRLGIDRICSWLARMIRRLTQGNQTRVGLPEFDLDIPMPAVKPPKAAKTEEE